MRVSIWPAIVVMSLSGLLRASGADDVPATELDDARVRILICTPQGPLIVQLSLTNNGRPYRRAAEDLIDRRLAAITAAPLEPLTWAAALEQPQFVADWFPQIDAMSSRESLIAEFDADRDGLIGRRELRAALLQQFDGEILRFVMLRPMPDPNEDLLRLIDVNRDLRLSREEIVRAPERIAARDFSGDGVVNTGELAFGRPSDAPPASVGILLGSGHDPAGAARLLRDHYADIDRRITRQAFQVAPDLFDRLDVDRDGELQDRELVRIRSLPPQITLASDQQDDDEANRLLLLRGISPGLNSREFERATAAWFHRWHMGPCPLDIHGRSSLGQESAAVRVKELFRRYDNDENGYLELAETRVGESSPFRPEQFKRWDANGDRQLFPIEIEAALDRELAVSRCWIQISLTRHAPRFWSSINRNNDRLLSERELRQVVAGLLGFDADGDGEVAYHEMPFHISFHVARGDRDLTWNTNVDSSDPVGRPPFGPGWFRKMDRNLDGDVSRQEFLGTAGQFERLDADHDGLIDPREAEAAATP